MNGTFAGAPLEKAYIRCNRHGKPYLVRRVSAGGRRKEQWIPLDRTDREILESTLRIKEIVRDQIVLIPCMNPRCNNMVPMTKKQLEEFFISSKKRYDLIVFPFCKPECRNEVLAQHGGAIDGSHKS